jgi:hypothetical protein
MNGKAGRVSDRWQAGGSSFAHKFESSGTRRRWLWGIENVQKRYLIAAVARNLGLLIKNANQFRQLGIYSDISSHRFQRPLDPTKYFPF